MNESKKIKRRNCNTCGEELTQESSREVFCSKECKKIYNKKYYAENRERILLQKKQYHAENREIILKKLNTNYIKNKEERKKIAIQYYKQNKEKVLKQIKVYRQTEGYKETKRRSYKNHPEQKFARDTVYLAIKSGNLTRQPCTICETEDDIHAHHEDYSMPLEVNWLCRRHHEDRHLELRA